jgi:hypothetical protein
MEDDRHVVGAVCELFSGGFGTIDVLNRLRIAKKRIWIQDVDLSGFDESELFAILETKRNLDATPGKRIN